MINLELPKRLRLISSMARDVAEGYFRPISRKYDGAEHEYPQELDYLAAIVEGMGAAGSVEDVGIPDPSASPAPDSAHVRNGSTMASVLAVSELSWGDVGLLLTMPGQGLGNAAINALASDEQKTRWKGKWAAMAITEPNAGSDSAAIRTTAMLEGDEYVINGEKIYVTCGERAELVVVWASLNPSAGRAAIKSFVVERNNPGLCVERLDRKMGIRASDTAVLSFSDCRVPRDCLLGSEEISTEKSFSGAMKTFDNTRPIVAAMALGVARASLERTRELLGIDTKKRYRGPVWGGKEINGEMVRMEAELESARLLTLKAAWLVDNRRPNALEASMAKAKAARVANAITLRCVELCGPLGYEENELLEKWARDSKILDIFEGTQQIQLLIIARHILEKRSHELR